MPDNLPGMIYRGQKRQALDDGIRARAAWAHRLHAAGAGGQPVGELADLIHPEDRDFVWNYVQMQARPARERYEPELPHHRPGRPDPLGGEQAAASIRAGASSSAWRASSPT